MGKRIERPTPGTHAKDYPPGVTAETRVTIWMKNGAQDGGRVARGWGWEEQKDGTIIAYAICDGMTGEDGPDMIAMLIEAKESQE